MFLCLVALALPALGFTVGTILYGAAHNRFLMLTVLFAALGCYGTVMMIRYAVKFRIALWPDRIEVRSARRTITIRRRDIAGFRRVKATRMLFWGRVPHRLTYVSRFLRSDGELDAWIDSLPDYETILKLGEKHDASSDPSLGHTRAERLARFRSAKLIDTILGIIGFGVGLWVWLYPEPYLLSLLSLAAFPWVLIAIEKLSGTDRFFGPNRWRMSSAIVLFWISGLFIVLPSPFIISNVYQMEPIRTMVLGLVGGSVLTAILIWWDVRVRRTPLLLVCTLIGACLYAGGSLYAANVALDSGEPELIKAEVTGKRVRHRRHGDSWYLRLRPPSQSKLSFRWISVSKTFYDATPRGQSVCLSPHPGALGVPWLTIDNCIDPEFW